jgi:hypothetical protein
MRLEPLRRISEMGAAAQACVPGLYAWGVTVAPAVWTRGASVVAKVAAVVALLVLVGSVAAERRWKARARIFGLWGFVLACALAWSAAPAAFAPLRIDAPRGLAGMAGWALFALASAAPALHAREDDDRVVLDDRELLPRRGLGRGDVLYVAVAACVAVVLQLFGWRIAVAERALLVRLVALALGLAILGASVDVALTRHLPRVVRSTQGRMREATGALVVLALLGLVGVLFVVRG